VTHLLSAFIHGLGFIAAFRLWWPFLMAKHAHNKPEPEWIFGFGALSVLLMSTLYHAFAYLGFSQSEEFFRRMDHSAIWICFLFAVLAMHRKYYPYKDRRVYDLIIVVLIASVLVLKNFFFEKLLGWPGLILYLSTFLLGGVSLLQISNKHGFKAIRVYLLGISILGLAAFLERLRIPVLWENAFSYHEVFHLLVLLGLYVFWHGFKLKSQSLN
jgi:channel protein (hemolysin III family)